jgi:hypothetical protein
MKYLRYALVAIGLLISSQTFAATVISTASGNIDSSGTWSLVDSATFLNSETANTALTTSYTGTNAATPGALTVQGIAVKIASVAAAPTGTMTCQLLNSTGSISIDSVTVNVSDLVTAAAATSEGGWAVFEFGSTHLLLAVTNYEVQCKTSSAAQVNLFSSGTTVWSQMLITTTAQAPVAGDSFFVFGQLTGAGTHNGPFTVTIETTSLVNYGSAACGVGAVCLAAPSVSVGQYGVLQFASAASTAYVFEFAGPAVCYNGGTFNRGTAGTPIPATSSATMTYNSIVEGDTGFNFRNGCTTNSVGSANGRTVVKTKLTATANASATSLTVADSTGWLSGDSIVIAPTQTGGTLFDAVALTGNASGTTLTSAAITNQHTAVALSYTSTSTLTPYALNMYADVILLNRNVVIKGSGATTNGYEYYQANANATIAWTEFTFISGAVAKQRGLEVDIGPLGSFSLTNSSFHDSHNSCIFLAPTNTTFGGTPGTYLLIQHNVIYNCASAASGVIYGLALAVGFASPNWPTNPFWKIDDLAVIRTGVNDVSANAINIASQNGVFTNISISGSGHGSVAALTLTGTYSADSSIGGQVGNAFGPITTYANVTSGNGSPLAVATFGITGTISGLYMWHEGGRYIPFNGTGGLTIDPFYIVTNNFGVYIPSSAGGPLTLRNGVIGFDVSNSSNYPLTVDAVNVSVYFDNMELAPVGSLGGVTFFGPTVSQGLVSLMHDTSPSGGTVPSNAQVFLRNSSLLGSLGTAYPTQGAEESYYGNAFIVQDCNACTTPALKHDAWIAGGFLSYDLANPHTANGYSLRMTPRVNTVTGYITNGPSPAPATLTTSATIVGGATLWGDSLTSNGTGFVNGSVLTAGTGTSFTVSQAQNGTFTAACNSTTKCQFQSYNNQKGTLLRLQSAPVGEGTKIAVASGVSTAQACAWIRPSINTDAAPLWGGSAVTYNGDNPRMIVRANPYMNVQSDTVIGTSSPTAGSWSQFCATLPTAPADGEFEVVIDADQTFTSNAGGSVNVTEWSCTTCNNANGSQYWWNGVPTAALAPASSGGGSHIIGTSP